MAKPNEKYQLVDVESYVADDTSGLHGAIHIRPVAGGMFPDGIRVECPREMRDPLLYSIGTVFRIRAKLTDRKGGGEFLYSHHSWPFSVISR